MKKILGCMIVWLVCAASHAGTTFNVTKLVDNGPDDKRLVWVFTGDGYTSGQIGMFRVHVQTALTAIFSIEPWSTYEPYVNVYVIDAISNESGADHPLLGTYVDTFFNATYDTGGVARLLTVDDVTVLTTVFSHVPTYDSIFTIVNDTQYGGAGGDISVFSTSSLAYLIASHEYGHTFAGLADEYSDPPLPGYPPGDPEPNVTYQVAYPNIPWNAWIDTATPLPTPTSNTTDIGLFEGARYVATGIYRPKLDCAMRTIGRDFCAVCEEAHILALYTYTKPIEGEMPAAGSVVDISSTSSASFEVFEMQPIGHNMQIQWELDGTVIAGETQSVFTPAQGSIPAGTFTLTARVTDPTASVRLDPSSLLEDTRTWTLNVAEDLPPTILATALDVHGRVDDSAISLVVVDGAAVPVVNHAFTARLPISPRFQTRSTIVASDGIYSHTRTITLTPW